MNQYSREQIPNHRNQKVHSWFFYPMPYPESWSGQGLNSMFLSEMKRLAPGDHHVSYTAYINLDLIDDGGSKVHTEYLILEKTLNFTI